MTIWQNPPVQGRGVWVARLKPLRKRPGQWALVYQTPTANFAHSLRYRLSKGEYQIPPGIWEFKARKTDQGGEVYARYLGKKNAAESPALVRL